MDGQMNIWTHSLTLRRMIHPGLPGHKPQDYMPIFSTGRPDTRPSPYWVFQAELRTSKDIVQSLCALPWQPGVRGWIHPVRNRNARNKHELSQPDIHLTESVMDETVGMISGELINGTVSNWDSHSQSEACGLILKNALILSCMLVYHQGQSHEKVNLCLNLYP